MKKAVFLNGFFILILHEINQKLADELMSANGVLSKPFLLSAEDLSKDDINLIFDKAKFFMQEYKRGMKFDDLKGVTVCMAFFEPSTRTKLSFDLAAKRLSAESFSFSSSSSSLKKGESLLDTLRTIEAMGVQIYVVRHGASGAAYFLQQNTGGIVVNAGDGKHQHPTQSLLDAFTLYRKFGDLAGTKVCIIGDIFHSRVARSNISMLRELGAEVKLCSPGTLFPKRLDAWDSEFLDSPDEAVEWADVLLVLRLQRERMDAGLLPTLREFSNYYGVRLEHFSRKPDLALMHPGPVNYGIELDYKLSAYPNTLIQTQVTHGVFIRMAVLSILSESLK